MSTLSHSVVHLVERSTNSASATVATDRAASFRNTNGGCAVAADLCDGNVNANVNSNVNVNSNADASSPRILACSVRGDGSPSVQSLQAKLLAARKRNELLQNIEKGVDEHGYPLCEFRKGFLDHYRPKSLIISSIRVTLQQGTTILAGFMGDQLELDLKRNQRVNVGEITQMEADLEADEWEKIEWEKRWKTLPNKFVAALVKYHSVTLILRFYEYVVSKVVDMHKLNKLTMDPFVMSRRMASRIENKSPLGKTETVRDHKMRVTQDMTVSTLWANLLPFCADYSLHQALLCYGYFKYYNYQRQRRLLTAKRDEGHSDVDETDESSPNGSASALITDDDKELAKDLGWKSLRLAGSRQIGLLGSALGAGIGTVVWPGWGTIVFTAIGDGAGGMIMDDGYFKARQELRQRQAEDEARDDSISRQVQ
mmetsp:Transcript_8647/g.21272  ORF Transcript_8647/g.21272 Transcript_8647/m.21272 type:complete len:426 (-) Transcript_8647:5-1282(-)